MEYSIAAFIAALAMAVASVNAVELAQIPMQTFYVPLHEEELFNDLFKVINAERTSGDVETMISIGVSTDNTVIWYDHFEDGFDSDPANATLASATTEIWGDGNASNGCRPDASSCTDDNDYINAGDNIILRNIVGIPRDLNVFEYDGGDRVQASYPVAMTRGAYPEVPGSLLAGAVEVLDQSVWGTEYTSPLGSDIGFAGFQYSGLWIMAGSDDTTVTFPDGSNAILSEGQSANVDVLMGDKITADKPIQVDLITGDIDSYYELRWFSLLPTKDWSNDYVSPVGDTFGKTRVLVYNPNDYAIVVNYEFLKSGNSIHKSLTVPAKAAKVGKVIPTNSGSFYKSTDGNFIALSLTDTSSRASNGQITYSEWYDWGFPVAPRHTLTNQVLIGLGFGCTDNQCYGEQDRSVIWVTPVEDADIYIDYANTGIETDYAVFPTGRLVSMRFTDPDDTDMSGAIIFATSPDSGPTGPSIAIAAAWGQDPSRSYNYQAISLDLGTLVVPFQTVTVNKVASKSAVQVGETFQYTIKVVNMKQTFVNPNTITVLDSLDTKVEYVPGSLTYSYDDGSGSVQTQTISDNSSGTPYPLDEEGHLIQVGLHRRGGSIDICFEVTVVASDGSPEIVNSGSIVSSDGEFAYGQIVEIIIYSSINIENEVYIGAIGDNGETFCETDTPGEHVEDLAGVDVVYCLNVTNTGESYLTNIIVSDGDLAYDSTIDLLSPGETVWLSISRSLDEEILNTATVFGTPAHADGTALGGVNSEDVSDSDTSSVNPILVEPSISIDNTVALSTDTDVCGTEEAVDRVEHFVGTPIILCWNVTNDGNVPLDSVVVNNVELAIFDNIIGVLQPGESVVVAIASNIGDPMINHAVATGNPTFTDGSDIPKLPDVTASDPSEVGVIDVAAAINIENTVALGADSDFVNSVEHVDGDLGEAVTYFFNVTNTGNSWLDEIEVTDEVLGFTDNSIGVLAPGQSVILSYTAAITANSAQAGGNVTNDADVIGTPVFKSDFSLIPLLDKVTDSDPSSSASFNYEPSIDIDNTVFLGLDDGCETAVEEVMGENGGDVTYCFNVTNTGNTHLANIVVDNEVLFFSDNEIGTLAPGESATITMPTIIFINMVNFAVVVGTPVSTDGKTLDLDIVTATDSSAVVLPGDADARSTVKPPYSPPNDDPDTPDSCAQNAYDDAMSRVDELVCTSNDAILENIVARDSTVCAAGEIITISVDASIHFTASATNDLAWYVATDGGDALTGTCVVNGLQNGVEEYKVVSSAGATDSVGSVSWDSDDNGTNDACGDITLTSGASGNIDTPIIVDLAVKCSDANEDGTLDVSVCFTWNPEDEVCTLDKSDPLTVGILADAAPERKDSCYCERYEISNVSVTTQDDDIVQPCR